MYENSESGYGKTHLNTLPFTTGKTFVLVGSSSANKNLIDAVFGNDPEGVRRVYTSYALVNAQTVAGRGDTIILAPDFTTAPSATELLSLETKGVAVIPAGKTQVSPGVFRAYRATAALPASTSSAIFTATGRVKIISIVGQVTTVVQTQLNNTKLIGVPTVGSSVDLCAIKDITAAAVGTELSITGTLATAMVQSVGAYVYQASPLTVLAGTINLSCSATNTGSVKWLVDYSPIDPGAVLVAA
jgi:hypothetical protein